jgi:hypothetical protein
MKKILFLSLFAFCSALALKAQPLANSNANEHSIVVTGMAEMEVVPDEIYVNVCLREFTKDKKKYLIEDLEAAFLNFIEKTTGTPRSDVKMDYTDARIIAMKRKQKDAVIEKTYEVKFKNNDQVTMLFIAQDSLNTDNVYIKRYSHSKLDELKQQVRTNAMADAKNKATYMLAPLGQKPGPAIFVYEFNPDVLVFDGIDDQDYDASEISLITGGIPASYSSFGKRERLIGFVASDEDYGGRSYSDTPIQKTIKLKYWVNVTFSL